MWKDLQDLFVGTTSKLRIYASSLNLNFIGFIPIRVRLDMAMHRNILGIDSKGKPQKGLTPAETLPGVIQSMGIHCFPFVRETSYYVNASFHRLPVGLYRPKIDAAKDFDAVVAAVIELLF